jgi:hypothetical protein
MTLKISMKLFLLFCLTGIFPLVTFCQETHQVTFFDKVELTIPVSFTEMSKDDIQEKFTRGTPPDIVYSEEKGSPSVSISLKNNKISQESISEYVELIEKSITTPLPVTKIIGKGKELINDRNVGYIILVTPSANGDIYNYMFFTDLDKKLLLCNFSCMNNAVNKWEDIAKMIVNSLKIKQ